MLVTPAAYTFRHGASVRCFDYFVVHRAVACQILEVRGLEESGISPHHPAQVKLKRSFEGLIARVQATPKALPPPIIGSGRKPRCWESEQEMSMDERWALHVRCAEQEILEGPAQDTRWWRMLSNRLCELWFMQALPTRRPQQPEQIERLRAHLCRMVTEAQTSDGGAEIWRTATQTHGENELQDLRDVHWKTLTVLDKMHKRDRIIREKEIAEYAKEASKGAAGLLHHLTKLSQGMRHNEKPPNRATPQTWQSNHGPASGALTSKSCKKRTSPGKSQTVWKRRNSLSSRWMAWRVSTRWLAQDGYRSR